jgi:hypothetical protein
MVNLTNEFNIFLDLEGDLGIGHWVLLRHFTDEISDYWDEFAKEAIGGPKYKYIDTLVRGYSAPAAFGMAMAADGKTRLVPGDIPTRSTVYYLKSSVVVTEEDIIFELNWEKKEKPTQIVYVDSEVDLSRGIIAPVKKAEVLKVIRYSSDTAGLPDYLKLFTEEHMV